jgi:pantetheine-phosphate adenylyltransferase
VALSKSAWEIGGLFFARRVEFAIPVRDITLYAAAMRTAVYAGSFDPPTNGHLWMIERGLEMFDCLIVAIGDNPSKRYSFTVEERLDLLRASTVPCENLIIARFDNRYLVDYAGKKGAKYVLRGIRSPHDYEYERVMRQINADMAPEIITVFLMPPRDIAEVSSNMIKSLIGPKGWEETVRRYVPEPVFQLLARQDEDGPQRDLKIMQ